MQDDRSIIDTLHEHDRRLVRVETELHGVRQEVATLRGELREIRDQIGEMVSSVGEAHGSLQIILWIVGIGVPLIVGLELWSRL